MLFRGPAARDGGRSHRLPVPVASLALGLIAAGYLLFMSPTFAAWTAGMSIVTPLPRRLRRKMADTLMKDVDKKGRYNVYRGSSDGLERAAKMCPDDPGIWWRLCTSYEALKRWDLALSACQKGAELRPDEDSLGDLSAVYMHRHEYSQAARVLEAAPNDYSPRIQALLASGQYEMALPVAQLLVDLSEQGPENVRSWVLPDALREVAFAYQQLGEKRKAREALERLHELDRTLNYRSCEMRPDLITDIPVVQCF
jgi:tetratricopeptide (TPR) repeat protein